ncbi:MAG: trehalose-phosphatase [Deltaproteobacteria bacterium]
MTPGYFFTDQDHASRIARPGRKTVLFLDFDGTMVPIQSDPSSCVLSAALKEKLRLLAVSGGCRLAIVSGRTLPDIRKRVAIRNVYYAGSHGLDISGPSVRYTHPCACSSRQALRKVKQEVSKEIEGVSGARLEDKGFTLCLHFREVAREEVRYVRRAFHGAVARHCGDGPFTVIKGKKVLELTPDAAWDKGQAVLWILRHLGGDHLPIYVGDDRTDETAFKALRKKGLTIRIGTSRKTFADFYLKGCWEVPRLLDLVAASTAR